MHTIEDAGDTGAPLQCTWSHPCRRVLGVRSKINGAKKMHQRKCSLRFTWCETTPGPFRIFDAYHRRCIACPAVPCGGTHRRCERDHWTFSLLQCTWSLSHLRCVPPLHMHRSFLHRRCTTAGASPFHLRWYASKMRKGPGVASHQVHCGNGMHLPPSVPDGTFTKCRFDQMQRTLRRCGERRMGPEKKANDV